MGHPYMCAVVVALQFLVFRELVHVRDNPAKDVHIPLFPYVQWTWFLVAMFFAHGSSFLKAPLRVAETLSTRIDGWRAAHVAKGGGSFYPTSILALHREISFSLFAAAFVMTVLSLKKGSYRRQMGLLTWTALTIGRLGR